MRRKIIEAIGEDESLHNWANYVDDVVFPRQDAAPLPHLPVYTDGLKCKECARMYTHIKGMQQHCRQEHGWQGTHQRTRGRPLARQDMWTTVSCQKFHNTGTLGRLFQVSGNAPVEPVQGMDLAIVANIAATIAQVSQALREADRKPSAIQDDESQWSYKK